MVLKRELWVSWFGWGAALDEGDSVGGEAGMSRNGTARGPIGRMSRGRSIIWRVQKARIGEIYWWRSDSMVLKRELWVSRFNLFRFNFFNA
jgi:hypothetical protein